MTDFGYVPELNRPADIATVEAEMRSMHVVSQLLPCTMEELHAPSIPQRHNTSAQEFADRFDALVDILCGAAKEGVTERRQKRYTELRSWFQVRQAILADILNQTHGDSCNQESTDCLHSLFQPESIEGVINSESVILRMMHVRSLVDSCCSQAEAVQT